MCAPLRAGTGACLGGSFRFTAARVRLSPLRARCDRDTPEGSFRFTTMRILLLSNRTAHTQVAVPRLVARVLTYPERVNAHNIERLRAAVLNGPQVWPGANSVEVPPRNGRGPERYGFSLSPLSRGFGFRCLGTWVGWV